MGHKGTVRVRYFGCGTCGHKYQTYRKGKLANTGCPKCREKAFEQNGTLPRGSETEPKK